MKILYKDKNIVAVTKPVGMPVQQDTSGDEDLMSALSQRLRSLGEDGRLWLVHRLDRVVGGVVVFARNKQYASRLSELFSDREADKYYFAVVEGRADGGLLEDYIYKDAGRGMAFVVDAKSRDAKASSLEYEPVDFVTHDGVDLTLVFIKLHTGRFHQIRAQFSSRKMALVGDGKYGGRIRRTRTPALFACRVRLTIDGKPIDIYDVPDASEYPWSLFGAEKYEVLK